MFLELLNLGKDYPKGVEWFRPRLHRAFMANAHLKSEDDIRKGIARADFVRKGADICLATEQVTRKANTDVILSTEIEAL